jgi:glutaryl-CoA dehydrogenase (non-decarboxylating)
MPRSAADPVTLRAEASEFARLSLAPQSGPSDEAGRLPPDRPAMLAAAGLLGLVVPQAHGGREADPLAYGWIHAEIGAVCASTRAILTVHDMVAAAIGRWGDDGQRAHWLPRLAAGELLGAFALTEPETGSDARAVRTTATREGGTFVLRGHKCWITAGQVAGLFAVFARCEEKPTAFLVERDAPGLRIVAMPPPLGLRAAMLAEIFLDDVRVPAAQRLGPIGAGISHIASTALDLGRYGVAWGCVGMQQAALAEAAGHARERVQFDVPLREHQLIQELVAEMAIDLRASHALCEETARLRAAHDPEAIISTAVAKTFASRAALRAATRTVQILGARGCAAGCDAQRRFRDAKVMEIIEGSTQMQQILIALDAFQRQGRIV